MQTRPKAISTFANGFVIHEKRQGHSEAEKVTGLENNCMSEAKAREAAVHE